MKPKIPTKITEDILPKTRRILAKRRLVLLASAAAIGAAVMLAGPGYRPIAFEGTTAHAIEVQPQAGFADLIEKVKPAVISVRVKIEQDDKTVGSGMEQFGDNDSLRRFFREFGMPGLPGLGLGFLHFR
jgi:serine protease Do